MAKYSDISKGDSDSRTGSHWMDRREHRDWSHFGRTPSRRERGREQLLKDWFGEDLGRLEIVERQRPAEHVSGALDEVFRKFGMHSQVLIHDIQAKWAELVGADIAAQSAPIQIRGNRLLVEVVNSSWMYVLNTMHRQDICTRVRDFTDGSVNNVTFVPPGRHYERRRPQQ